MMNRTAEFSVEGIFRHRLDRWWGPVGRVGWLMLNPSSAGAEEDDPTIRKVTGFSARWGFQGFTVINFCDLVLTDPSGLHLSAAPCSNRNRDVIDSVAGDVELLICAWGCETVVRRMVKRGMDPMDTVRRIRAAHPSLPIECLGTSPTGCPYHPLMLAYATERQPFEVKL